MSSALVRSLVETPPRAIPLSALLLMTVLAPLAAAQDSSKGRLTNDELAELAPSFVLINFHFKRSEEHIRQNLSLWDWDYEESDITADDRYEAYIDAKTPLKAFGIVVEDNVVLTNDIPLHADYIDSIVVRDARGGTSPARRLGILEHAAVLLLELDAPADLQTRPLTFSMPSVDGAEPIPEIEVGPTLSEEDWLFRARPIRVGLKYTSSGEIQSVFGSSLAIGASPLNFFSMGAMSVESNHVASPALLLDKQKRPVGIATSSQMYEDSAKPPLWNAAGLLSDTRISFDRMSELTSRIGESMESSLLEIKVTFRQKIESSGGMFEDIFAMYPFAGGDTVPTEQVYFGLLVDDRRLFIPNRIEREFAKKIDTITVKTSGGEIEATFVGAFKDLAAFMVEAKEDLATGSALSFDADHMSPNSPLVTLRAQERFGTRHLETNYSRHTGTTHGYKDKAQPTLVNSEPTGTMLFDFEGNLRGIVLEQREDNEAIEALRDPAEMFSPFERMIRPYEISELESHIETPIPRLDKTIVALGEDEEHRRMWLGVEFEAMSAELAESLDVERQTKDGSVGMLISTVYPGSPAEALELNEGDILLALYTEQSSAPIELQVPEEYDFDFDFDFSDMGLPEGMDILGMEMPKERPWKGRDNLMTEMLEVIGEGEKVTLSYVKDWADRAETTFTIERSPSDYDSAPKIRDDDVGLTVKELTFEVRHALKVPMAMNPVVVSKVEEGSPADVARIESYDLILRIGNTEIDGIASFEAVVAQAKEQAEIEGAAVLRCTVQKLSQTRLADITLD